MITLEYDLRTLYIVPLLQVRGVVSVNGEFTPTDPLPLHFGNGKMNALMTMAEVPCSARDKPSPSQGSVSELHPAA